MSIRIVNQHESPEFKCQAALEEFKNSHLAASLQKEFREFGNQPVEMVMAISNLEVVNQIKEGDGLGCAVCCYRMGIEAQGGEDFGQSSTRWLVETGPLEEGNSGNMVEVSTIAARKAGMKEVKHLADIRMDLPPDQQRNLQGKGWAAVFTIAIEKGNFAIVGLPMNRIYKGATAGINHAILIKGVRYEGGNNYKLIINDPLERADTIDLEPFVREITTYNSPIVVAPHKYNTKDDWLKMSTTIQKVSK